MPKEKDTFSEENKKYLTILPSSTIHGKTRKEKNAMKAFSLQLQFGCNRKQDNQQKTKQVKLF